MLHEGIERGVDDLGYLLLESNGQIQKIVSGDVSLRKLT
jgi:biotin-(acetyl-CoA carboxylase) ligase